MYIYIPPKTVNDVPSWTLMGWENVSWAGPSYGRLHSSRDMEVTSNPSCFEPHKQIYHVGCFKMVNRNIGVRDVFDCFCSRDIISLSLSFFLFACVLACLNLGEQPMLRISLLFFPVYVY